MDTVGFISKALKDRIDGLFQKACRWKLTSKQYNLNDL